MHHWKKLLTTLGLAVAVGCASQDKKDPAEAQPQLPAEETEAATPAEPERMPGEQGGEPSSGVEAERPMMEQTIAFQERSTTIEEPARQALTEQVQWLDQDPDRTLIIDVAQEEATAPDFNMETAKQRARNVKDYLVKMGVDQEQIVVVPQGETPPTDVAPEATRTLLIETGGHEQMHEQMPGQMPGQQPEQQPEQQSPY